MTLRDSLAQVQELKPCPFCGSDVIHHFEHSEGHESYGLQCTRCWTTGPQFGNKLDAITAWNTRPALLRDAGDGWLPIESAPNGVWFLAHSERGWIGLARRADPDYAPGEGWFEDEHTEYLNPAWLTHWRPLPQPPAMHAPGGAGGGLE